MLCTEKMKCKVLNGNQTTQAEALFLYNQPLKELCAAANEKGEACFLSGANVAISGDMLTTSGIAVESDIKLLEQLGYEARLCNE